MVNTAAIFILVFCTTWRATASPLMEKLKPRPLGKALRIMRRQGVNDIKRHPSLGGRGKFSFEPSLIKVDDRPPTDDQKSEETTSEDSPEIGLEHDVYYDPTRGYEPYWKKGQWVLHRIVNMRIIEWDTTTVATESLPSRPRLPPGCTYATQRSRKRRTIKHTTSNITTPYRGTYHEHVTATYINEYNWTIRYPIKNKHGEIVTYPIRTRYTTRIVTWPTRGGLCSFDSCPYIYTNYGEICVYKELTRTHHTFKSYCHLLLHECSGEIKFQIMYRGPCVADPYGFNSEKDVPFHGWYFNMIISSAIDILSKYYTASLTTITWTWTTTPNHTTTTRHGRWW